MDIFNNEGKIEVIKGRSLNEKLPHFVTQEAADEAYEFHKTLPEYKETPLVGQKALSEKLGVAGIYTKDESKRFGLKAFKALGASFAVSKINTNDTDAFVTATDGNHGKAVAWAAEKAGKKAFVFMPEGSAQGRVDAIASIGETKVEVTDLSYDDAVKYAAKFASDNGYILVQDTGFEGYSEIPDHITQGYTTMVRECLSQLKNEGIEKPTHVIIQAGVGSLGGAVAGYLTTVFGEERPVVILVEPSNVACIYESAKKGEIVVIDGITRTDMAGLNCGAPNILTWPILRDYVDFYSKCPDWVTWQGMRRYADPVEGDPKIISGGSGGVDLGLLINLMTDPELSDSKDEIRLNEDSVILLFNTEGDTDPENYERVLSMK